MKNPIRFGDWVWDPNTLELRNGSRVVTLEPRVARLLEFLLNHPGELFTYDRLVESVWEGRIVSNEAVRHAVFTLRQALAVEGGSGFIRTIHKKGYIAEFPPYVIEERETPSLPTVPASDRRNLTSDPASGLAKPAHQDFTRLASSRRIPMLLGLLIMIALAAVLLTRLDLPWERRPASIDAEVPAKGPATIAVLPFIDFSNAADSEVLADGLICP